MKNNKITIKEIAEMAGVSIATVSHVINRTRYVNPELIKRVEKIIDETGYIEKLSTKKQKMRAGGYYYIAGIVPNVTSSIYRKIVSHLRRLIMEQGYQFIVLITGDDPAEEQVQLESLVKDKRVAGILHVPVSDVAANYKKLIVSRIPFVCIERNIHGEGIDSVEFRDREALFKGTNYLLECGHKNLLFLREEVNSTTKEERTKGYEDALVKHQMNVNDANIVDIDLYQGEEECEKNIRRKLRQLMPTAVIAGDDRLTLYLIKALRKMGIRYPDEISIIGFEDETWMELLDTPLTTLKRDAESISVLAVKMLFEKINTGSVITQNHYVEIALNIRESTKILYDGPYGETAVTPDAIALTSEEKNRLRNGNYRVAISFHYTGTAWAELHERGIRDELERYGIDVISVTDAHFD